MDITDQELDQWEAELTCDGVARSRLATNEAINLEYASRVISRLIPLVRKLRRWNTIQSHVIVEMTTSDCSKHRRRNELILENSQLKEQIGELK